MKKCQFFFVVFVAMLTLFLTGCTDQGGNLRIHKYINQSGVEIAMVGEAYGNIPDSLVIPNGETYEFRLEYPGMQAHYYFWVFPYNFGNPYKKSEFIPIKVYYNKDICLRYTFKDKGKNPLMREEGSYTYEVKRRKNLVTSIYTYIFTPEDYQNAINSQN